MTAQWGHGVPARGNGHLRASTADRESTIEVLKTGFTEGRLTKDEYDDRVAQTYAARTYADLATVTADLPGGQVAVPAWPPPAPVAQRTNPLAIASLACGLAQPFTGGLTMIPAVILGHAARSQIRRTGEGGIGLATAGLVLGWTGVIMMLLLIMVFIGAAATLNL
jgi:Domain of unknown function (DUF1707)/Domain of unknown function (DUF4190)